VNIVLIVIDSLRKDHVGANGNEWIHTPNLDAFARESVTFTGAYPESLPTLPVRRALFTGLRTYPFRGHKPQKGDFAGTPGWGPIPESQTTIAETLWAKGYRTALITDTYHYFKPSKNFHRGFGEWVWIRGQELDPWRTGPVPPPAVVDAHIPEALRPSQRLRTFLTAYYTNAQAQVSEADYHPARVFSEASRWLWDNADAERFFLVVDSFDPHEPWSPPAEYRCLYDTDESTVDVVQSLYSEVKNFLTPAELKRLRANYAGEVTLVDKWFGGFIREMKASGRLEDSVVAVISDHGHSLALPGDQNLVSKQGYPMTRSVAELVMMLRLPDGKGAGSRADGLCYNVDLPVTLLSLVDVGMPVALDGIDLQQAIADPSRKLRDYVTVAWGPSVTVIDSEWWYNSDIWGEKPLLYRRREDPLHEKNVAASQPTVCEKMRQHAIADAGGKIPAEFRNFIGSAGCTPYTPE